MRKTKEPRAMATETVRNIAGLVSSYLRAIKWGLVTTKTRPHLTIRFPPWEPEHVRIVTEKRIREFIEREPRSRDAMWHWVDSIESASWRNPSELRGTFVSVSFVGGLTVFNVGGNKYRIAAFIHYRNQIAYIKRIGTHEEYDKWDL